MLSWISLLTVLQFNVARAQAPADAAERAAAAHEEALKEVRKFAFYFADDRQRELLRKAEPVLRYTNPLRGEVYSTVFVWAHQGRPEAIGSISQWHSPRPYLGLSVTSLSQQKLIGTREGQEIWRPRSAGVTFRNVPEAEAPGDMPEQRLRQMKAFAREFAAEFKRDARVPEGGPLRLMSQPLYRYEGTVDGLIDGAIFGLADGTSPHLLLLLEARETAEGRHWGYALAPKNSTEYRVWHKGVEVWSLAQVAPPWPNSQNPTNTYSVFPDLQNEGRTAELAKRLADSKPLQN
jgi:hypothetical protein